MDSNHRHPRYKLGASNRLGYSPIEPQTTSLSAHPRRDGRADPGDDLLAPAIGQRSLTRQGGDPGGDLRFGDDRTERRAEHRASGRDQGGMDADDEVQIAVGEPVADAFGIALGLVQRVLGRDPAFARLALPRRPDLADRVAPAELMDDGHSERPDDQLRDRPAFGRHDIGRDDDVRWQRAECRDDQGERGLAPHGANGRGDDGETIGPRDQERFTGDHRQRPDEQDLEVVGAGSGDQARDDGGVERKERKAETGRDETASQQGPDDQVIRHADGVERG